MRTLHLYNFKVAERCGLCDNGAKLVADMKNDREREFAGCSVCKRFITTKKQGNEQHEEAPE